MEVNEIVGIPCIWINNGSPIIAGKDGVAAYPDGIARHPSEGVFRVRKENESEPDYFIPERLVKRWSYGLRGVTPVDDAVREAFAEQEQAP